MKRDDAQTIVGDIRALYELMQPVDVIARKLHVPERLVRRVIESGTVPTELPLHWKSEQ